MPKLDIMAKKQTKPVFDANLLKKRVFIRAINPIFTQFTAFRTASSNESIEAQAPRSNYIVMTQDDFLAELDPNSHAINNKIRFPNKQITEKIKGSDGEERTYIRETEIARISLPLQYMIAMRQAVHLWAKLPKFTCQRKSAPELFSRFKEYWTEKNASCALYLMAKSALTTGDGATYFFLTDKGLQYKVWSYKDGDMLIPVYKQNGVDMQMFIRRYYSVPEGGEVPVDTIDIYTDKTYKQMIQDGQDWIISIPEKTHGFLQIPIAYHREPDVAWGVGQNLIETIELFLSNVRESGQYFAYGILFLKGGDVEVLPTKETQGKVVVTTDVQGDAKMLQQTDMSASLTFEFKQYTEQLYRSTGTVIIDQATLKGGDATGAYIKNLYNDAVQYALDAKPRWQPVLEQIVSIVKEGLEIEDKNLDYRTLIVISDPDIYVPMNVAEEVRLLNESKTSGSLSEQTVAENHYYAAPDEWQRIQDELAKTQADAATIAAQNQPNINPIP